jgi:hypothetical protein
MDSDTNEDNIGSQPIETIISKADDIEINHKIVDITHQIIHLNNEIQPLRHGKYLY